jgi:mono/diheme cytochrome c family protein
MTGGQHVDVTTKETASATQPREQRRARRVLLIVVGVVVVLFGLIQLVPYRYENPAVAQEPTWDTARTRQLAVTACYNCHSNQTETYWWEDVAPISWWITNHVEEGRAALNFSECAKGRGESDAVETVRNGTMPPDYYT